MHEKIAFSVVSNGSPRCTETCAHVRTTSLWGVRSRQNGQLFLTFVLVGLVVCCNVVFGFVSNGLWCMS